MPETVLRLLRDTRAAHHQGAPAILRRQQTRLAHMVTDARVRSPYYRQLYHGLPERITTPTLLPVTSKTELMPSFDNWVTDPAVTITNARAFVDDPALVGEKFLGRYTATTTSGTTGTRGIFLMDQRSLAVTKALTARMLGAWLTPADIPRVLARGGRIAMVNATDGHFASAVAAAGLRSNRLRRALIGVFPVCTPMPQLVTHLNAYRPAILASYATTAALLAREQHAGRLHIDPVLVILSAEGLPATDYDNINSAFRGTVRQGYAATECPFLSYSCRYGWLHVNSDWALLEAVDAHHQPVPAGQRSHTTLLTNLANRVQPILRYDLGDSVLVHPAPCPCGDALPRIRVNGRTADLLTFPTRGGEPIVITPLTLSASLDRIPDVERFQIVQTGATELDVRLQPTAAADPDTVWRAVHAEINRVLTGNHLDHITITRGALPPQRSPGGKYRSVIPHLSPTRRAELGEKDQ